MGVGEMDTSAAGAFTVVTQGGGSGGVVAAVGRCVIDENIESTDG